jgi:hypothetical protein
LVNRLVIGYLDRLPGQEAVVNVVFMLFLGINW